MKTLRSSFTALLIILSFCYQVCDTEILEIQLVKYSRPTDFGCVGSIGGFKCNPQFKICFTQLIPPGWTSSGCKTSKPFSNKMNITFGDEINGIHNPIRIPVSSIPVGAIVNITVIQASGRPRRRILGEYNLNIHSIASSTGHVYSLIDQQHETSTLSLRLRLRPKINCSAPGPADHYTCDTNTGLKLCSPGYSGTNCTLTPCSNTPCENGGSCNISGSNFTCHCPSGYSGSTCATTPCTSNPCGNNGQCAVSNETYSCECQPGYSGGTCDATPCTSNPCENNGQCAYSNETYTCGCQPGYSGRTCDATPCSGVNCNNGGSCRIVGSQFRCDCGPGYSGQHCDTSPCTSVPCQNNGICSTNNRGYRCSCDPGYRGKNCEMNLDHIHDTRVSPELRNLSMINVTDSNVGEVVRHAQRFTENDTVLSEKDLVYSADVIEKASELTELSSEVAGQILDLANNVMKKEKETLQKSENLGRAPSRIIKSLEKVDNAVVIPESGALRLVTEGYGTTIWDLKKHATNPVIGLQLMESEAESKLTNQSLGAVFNQTDSVFHGTEAAIVLPKLFMENVITDYNSSNSSIRLTMHVFKDTKLFTVAENVTGRSTARILNSKVIAARLSVDKKSLSNVSGLQVTTVFLPNKIVKDEMRGNVTRCGFWDFSKDGGVGGWSVEGCNHTRVQNGRDVCVCDHLTNFAVLLDFYGQNELPEVHQLAMSIITIIGLSLSITGLSLTVLTFILFKKLRKSQPRQNLFNLALAQLCSWVVFLAGINETQNNIGCIAVAVLLHYFIVASFLWMLMEAVLLYLMVVKVLGSHVSRFVIKTAIPAWGIPLLPVVVVLGIDYNLYRGGDKYCWMSPIVLYYAFALPIGLIILVNLVLYIIVVVNICRKSNLTGNSSQSTSKKHLTSIKTSFFCFILLGLSWIFGYLAIADARVVFQYIFTVTNTIQGFLIFLVFTARDKDVRRSWKSVCCPKKNRTTSSSGRHSTSFQLSNSSTSMSCN